MVFDHTLPFKNDLEPFESFKEKPNLTPLKMTLTMNSVDFADYELTVDNARVFQDIFRLRSNYIEFMTINETIKCIRRHGLINQYASYYMRIL